MPCCVRTIASAEAGQDGERPGGYRGRDYLVFAAGLALIVLAVILGLVGPLAAFSLARHRLGSSSYQR